MCRDGGPVEERGPNGKLLPQRPGGRMEARTSSSRFGEEGPDSGHILLLELRVRRGTACRERRMVTPGRCV